MAHLTTPQSEAWLLIEGYCDAALAGAKGRVAELLDCDESDVDAELVAIGLERCGECRIWHSQADCNIDHPTDTTLFICHSCAEHLIKGETLKTYSEIRFADGTTCVCEAKDVADMSEGCEGHTIGEIQMTEAEFNALPEFES